MTQADQHIVKNHTTLKFNDMTTENLTSILKTTDQSIVNTHTNIKLIQEKPTNTLFTTYIPSILSILKISFCPVLHSMQMVCSYYNPI